MHLDYSYTYWVHVGYDDRVLFFKRMGYQRGDLLYAAQSVENKTVRKFSY